MTIQEQLMPAIKEAMKAKDKPRLEALRAIKKVFLEVKTAAGSDGTLSEADELKIVTKLVKQGRDSAALYKEQGREDLAGPELEQVAAMEVFLPKQMTTEEIEAVVAEIIASVGATSMQQMGQVMGQASKQMAGKADGGVISVIVKKTLASL